MDFRKLFIIPCVFILLLFSSFADENYALYFAVLKYGGGGDWYEAKVGIKNLMEAFSKETGINASLSAVTVESDSETLFLYPFVYINGHGNISFNEEERENLREYVKAGGFIFANDDFGMDESLRKEIKKLFPKEELIEIPSSHEIYHSFYDFSGVPKIHNHYEDKPSKGLGVFKNGRLVLYYIYNADIGDGWADEEVHGDSPEKRKKAISFGINVLVYALTR